MKKFIKSTVAVASAVAMSLTMASVPAVSVLADDPIDPAPTPEPEVYVPYELPEGEVHYILAGSFGKVAWNALAKDNEMTPVEGLDGVYSYTAELPANTAEEGEEITYQSEFKICRIDCNSANGWDGSLCVGTDKYADNQSQIKILNKEAGTYTIYVDTKTGAVMIQNGNEEVIGMEIKWVGFGDETQFMSPEDIAKTTVADWPADKVKVDTVPDIPAINAAFAAKVNEFKYFVPWNMADGEAVYTATGGFSPQAWKPLGRKNQMTYMKGSDGVYSFTTELPAYAEETEWQNRFKVCRINNTVSSGWDGSLCVGTTTYEDNQSQIRILNEKAGTFTIYFNSKTGAVAVEDGDEKPVALSIMWVGFDGEAPFMTPEEIAKTTVADWPEGKVHVDSVPDVAAVNNEFAAGMNEVKYYVPWNMADGENVYTVAGGCSPQAWKPLGTQNVMEATKWEGVYSFTVKLPVYDEATEWQNRFKVCRINSTVGDGWDASLCVGTDVYADNQSQIRILNKEEGTFTIYCDVKTGAVVVKDAEGKVQELSISWVGYDNETQFMTPEEIAKTAVADWPEGKVHVDKVPDVAAINNALDKKMTTPVVTNSLKLTCKTKTAYTGKAGNKITIKATVKGSSKKVTWKSSNTKVATVSASGTSATVKAKKAGTTVISAKANGITKKVTIKVKNPTITVKQGSKKVSSISLKKGKSTTLKVTTSPAKSGIKASVLSKSKNIKLTVKSDKITVKALKKGTAKFKITSGGASKTIKVKVK